MQNNFIEQTRKLKIGTEGLYKAEEITSLKIKKISNIPITFEAFRAWQPQKGTAKFIKINNDN